MIPEPKIPIANIYYLYCYAWERFGEGQGLAVGAERSPDLPNLLTHVLLRGVTTLLRRGLDRAYQPLEDEIATVRGHIELGPSLRLAARNARRLHCEFDELSQDVLHNQILKATLKRVCKLPRIEKGLAADARRIVQRLGGVSDIRLASDCFARVHLHRNNAYYDLLLRVARLLHDQLLPLPGEAGSAFRDVLRDEREMARVFEAFVRNFYRYEQSEYRVEPLTIKWGAKPIGADHSSLLPQMRVDVFLKSAQRHLIIDTKYYARTLQTFHGNSSFHSGNLYQLFSYLRNYEPQLGGAGNVVGMLLYPQVGDELDAKFEIHGHELRIATVNIGRPWGEIHDRLLRLI